MLHKVDVMLINTRVCVLQVRVTVANASALPRTGGCLESTASVTTETVTSMTASYAQVEYAKHTTHTHTPTH